MNGGDRVKLGFVSPGRWARKLAAAMGPSTVVELAGVASRDPASARAFSLEYGGTVHNGYRELLADPSITGVVLATPDHVHHEQAMAAFQAGKHVFVEKPIAHKIDLAVEMQEEARRRGLVLSVGMPLRRNGSAREIKRRLENGDLGSVVMVAANHGAPAIQSRDTDGWFFSAASVPGGPLDQLGVHYGDLLQYWFGPIQTVTGTYRRDESLGGYITAAVAVFTFASGLIASYTTHLTSAYVSNCIIFGERAAVHYNRAGQELIWEDILPPDQAKEKGPQKRALEAPEPLPFSGALLEEIEDFANCIRSGGRPEVGAEEGVSALRVVRAVIEACDTGRAVDVSEHTTVYAAKAR